MLHIWAAHYTEKKPNLKIVTSKLPGFISIKNILKSLINPNTVIYEKTMG